MGLLRDELERLLEKYPDPSLGAAGRMAFEIKNTDKSRLIAVGLVTDNKDPLCLGRLRMTLENIAPGAVSPWYDVNLRFTTTFLRCKNVQVRTIRTGEFADAKHAQTR